MLQIFSFTTERVRTNSEGEYQFSDLLAGGRYCVFPRVTEPSTSKTHVISSLDAALIFRHLVNLQPFSPCDSIAAEVSGDGTITAYDASAILRYVACGGCDSSLSPPSSLGSWHFEPPHRCFECLTYDETSDFDAVMRGDVSQNWPGGALSPRTSGTDIHVGQPKVTPQRKNTVTVPIQIDNPHGIIAADILLSYNPNDIAPIRASKTHLTSNWEIAYHIDDNGTMKIAMAGCYEPIRPGTIVEVEFEADSNSDAEASSIVNISALFNEGRIPSPPTIQYSLKISPSLSKEYTLCQNYPNPFNTTTTIHYTLPSAEHRAQSTEAEVHSELSALHPTLTIYNILGQEVQTLVDEIQEPGFHTVAWNGKDKNGHPVASGIYFYRLTVERWSQRKRMLLLK